MLAINTSEVAVLMKGGNCEQPLGEEGQQQRWLLGPGEGGGF